eukprot:s2423_g2.t1
MLHDCSCFDVGSTPPGYRAMPGAGDMTEVNYDPDIQSEVPEVRAVVTEERTEVEVPPVPSGTPIVIDTPGEEPETPVIATASDSASKTVKSTPKVKAMPRKTINKRAAAKGKPEKAAAKGKPAVKRMPRRLAVK